MRQNQLFCSCYPARIVACRDLLIYLFANLWPLEIIVDDVIAPVFHQIGLGWQQGVLDIYEERRACEICISALRELKSLLPPVTANAPTAIGGSVLHDHYSLPTFVVQLTLQANRWHATSLGSHLPLSAFVKQSKITIRGYCGSAFLTLKMPPSCSMN